MPAVRDMLRSESRTFSFEFFPPRTPEGVEKLLETAERLKRLAPSFVTMTYGAGGSTRRGTIDLTARFQDDLGLTAAAHLTCVGHAQDELVEILREIGGRGIENVMCLRGDPPAGQENFRAVAGGFSNAYQLIALARSIGDFTIGAAGYPEGHPECPDRDLELEHLKLKVSSGADFIVTQLFFEPRDYFAFVERARRSGIDVRILPGVMPALNAEQMERMAKRCGATVPLALARALESAASDREAGERIGIEWAIRQCEALLRGGAPGIHFYTLNQSRATETIFASLKRSGLA